MKFVILAAIVVVLLGLPTIKALAYLVKSRKLDRLSQLWDSGRLEEHLVACEDYLQHERPGSLMHYQVFIRYAKHLIVVGRWHEARAAFEQMSYARGEKTVRHYRRSPVLLHALLLEGAFEEARHVREANARHFERRRHDISSYQYLRFVLAVYEFYLGDMATARGMLHNLAGEQPPRYDRAQVLYFLGCAEYELGRADDAAAHLEKAAELESETYVPDAVAHFWEQHARKDVTIPSAKT